MINSPQDLLLKILNIIGYSDDKQKFINQFMLNINMQALLDLISTLSTDKQEEIKTILARSANHPDKITRAISAYFSQTQMQQAFEATSKKTFKEYIESIDHTLSVHQKQELAKIFQKLPSHLHFAS